MNLDLIKKLTRLANNNPNDNEANLAARKVCRMLEESNWSLPSVQSRPNTVNMGTPPHTWNDIRRSPTPEWSSKPPTESNEYDHQAAEREEHRRRQEDFYNFYRKNYWKPSPKQEEYFRDIFREGSYRGVDWGSNPFEPKKPPKEKRPLECTKCHKTVETGYVGNLFVCSDCQWSEYKGADNAKV